MRIQGLAIAVLMGVALQSAVGSAEVRHNPAAPNGDPLTARPARTGAESANAKPSGSPATKSNKKTHASCSLQGTTVIPADSLIFDAAGKGEAKAKLTGARSPFTLSKFTANAAGRVAIQTSRGNANVRIDGFANINSFRFFAAKDMAVDGAPGVWITHGQRLHLVSASAKGFVVERSIIGSNGQKVTATVGCGDITVEVQSPAAVEVPKKARTYQMKTSQLELFAEPRGKAVFTLDMDVDARKVFWSTTYSRGYVRVMSRADITIDAWAKVSDLSQSRHAEIFDMSAIAPRALAARSLALKDPPKPLKATSELPIHARPENALHAVGIVEKGAEFYAMEQSGDWTNIMPTSLAVLPTDGFGFWVRTAGLPMPSAK